MSLLEELAYFNKSRNISDFIETAIAYYLNELKRQERIRRDSEIISINAERFNKEAEENLMFQAALWNAENFTVFLWDQKLIPRSKGFILLFQGKNWLTAATQH